jgi:hypothetical protein
MQELLKKSSYVDGLRAGAFHFQEFGVYTEGSPKQIGVGRAG